MADLDSPRFRISDACRAARAEPNTVRAWLQRGHFTLGAADIRAAVNGASHSLSRRRVYQIAIAAELVALGIHPKRAASLAAGFTDVGNGLDPDSQGHERDPGALYGNGAQTWLVAHAGEDASRAVRVPADRSAWEILTWRHSAAVILPLDAVLTRVDQVLGGETA